MKIFTKALLAAGLALVGSRASAQTLYDNFETTRLLTYPVIGGQGTLAANTPNPGTNPVNGSTTCGAYTRSTTQYDVLVMKPTSAKMASVAPYVAGTKKISIKFRSPAAGVLVQAVLQNKAKADLNTYPLGKFGGDFNATTTVANGWETLTFTYAPGAAGGFDPGTSATDVDQMTLLVAPNTTSSAVYYIDDIMGPELVANTVVPAILLDNFEGTRLVNYPSAQGTLNQAAANPSSNGTNTSATCASFARDASQQYATITVTPKTGKFGDVSGYAAGTQTITMKFRSPAANTAVQIVLQNKAKTALSYPNGNYGGTFDATTTVGANTWETLTFRYTANAGGADATVAATDVDQLALLIAPGTTSNGATYYFDDLTGPAFSTATATRSSVASVAAFATPYPNPASGTVHLPVSLQKAAVVSLAVFDGLGRRVALVLDNQSRAAGSFEAELNSAKLTPGLYTCRLTVDGQPLTQQLSVE